MGSTTGDLRNNLSKLLRQIRRMKMELNADLNGLIQGTPVAFLPIIHHALMNYSLPLAQWLDEEGYEMFGKNDLRFIESLYKVLRDVFHYVPVLTREQFLATGFAERKMIMATDILRHCESKHRQLTQKTIRKRVTRKKRPVCVHQEVLTVHANSGLPNVCSEQISTNTKVEEDIGGENSNARDVSSKEDKETYRLPTVPNRCLEAHYSGTTSQPLLTTRSPVACNVVKHKKVTIDSDAESVTTLDPHINAATPSDVPSMSIVPYGSSSPTSWCSLPSADNSPTHTRSGSVTPTARSDNTTPNPGSCDLSPTHSDSPKEQSTNSSPQLTGKVEQLTELVEKMSAKILLLETRLQLMEGNAHQQEPLIANSENIPPLLPSQDGSHIHLNYSPPKSIAVPPRQQSPPTVLQQSLQTAQHATELIYRANSPETKQLIESLRYRAKQTKQLLAAATSNC